MSKTSLVVLSFVAFGVFTLFSYVVAKEALQQIDFSTTVKLQDHFPRRFDTYFSYFSLLGGVELTIGVSLLLALIALIRLKVLRSLGWLLILPASAFEVFGKIFIFHPAPPDLFHRNVLSGELTKFYVHTNFSYPSGHMTRTIFLVTVLLILALRLKNPTLRFISAATLLGYGFMMFVSRIYLGEHWLSDVIGGTLLGLATGLFSGALIISKKRFKIE
jgi:membrane-associated phospholipid phosphatase